MPFHLAEDDSDPVLDPSIQEAMQPAIEWARAHRLEELANICPANRVVYRPEMAGR